ncbi:hypothetical protein LTR66_008094 [Elasticomyces elasticus]|nr:hypothetical protein LTR66_009251 [Elasticomyces elasticus]KAK4983440.1 hypothetical protein LTR50_007215 [Elasticomyces elasticus]KAK4985683.1 hypothetical protein LTR66_008094 [Elasticomyces elasticus]
MRIRIPFAGLSKDRLADYTNRVQQSDKVLHFLDFFLLTLCFYWILETSRRRVINATLLVCTLVGGIGSEFLQGFLPNGRNFDLFDILANLVGSLSALALCSWYHKRMLERKRQAKNYHVVPGDELDDHDVELGERIGQQETGVAAAVPSEHRNVTEELDNWDENAEDWDDEPTGTDSAEGEGQKTPASSTDDGLPDTKKRGD